jgi:hypothetical protein
VPADVQLFLAAEALPAEVSFFLGAEALAAEVRIDTARQQSNKQYVADRASWMHMRY